MYTVNDESQHLLIHRVPAISLVEELQILCQKFGSIEFLKAIPDYETEPFCTVFHVKYNVIQSARFAKKHLDDRSFFGGILHVCYAPELESLQETRNKLAVRKREIEQRLNPVTFKTVTAEPLSKNYDNPIPSESNVGASPVTNSSIPPEASVAHCTSSFPKAPVAHCAPMKRIIYHKRKHSGMSCPSIILRKWNKF